MTRDVSLCIIRVERSCQGFNKNETEGAVLQTKRNFTSFDFFKGRRQISEIRIETYVPETTATNISSDLKNNNSTMAEGGEPVAGLAKSVAEVTAKKDSSIQFVSGNPFVETFRGIIHLFKEDELTDIESAGKRSQTVCILAVPATMTCSDLLTFTAACHEDIKHVRIIRDSSPNQYMALITFRSPKSAIEFYNSFNGVPFNNLEPEWCCHLVFVSCVEMKGEDQGASIPPVSHTELPICPVCLERMDESVDGILTILCNHAFHGSCLAKWGDTSCPVCRYVQTPEPSGDNRCLECNAAESLWICLICGHVGCGRYLHGHAYKHYLESHHCYSMQLGSNSVWDYVGDNFVHRILQNKTDGKLVEGPNPEKEAKAQINSIQLEYTYLLTSQLESQRTYFEEMNNSLKESLQQITSENARLNEKLEKATKDKLSTEKKLTQLNNKFSQLQKNLEDEKELNSAMVKNQSVWKEKLSDVEKEFSQFKIEKFKELDDVKEQLRDVMFYLEAQKTLSTTLDKEELLDSKIEVPRQAEGKKSRTRKHKNNQ